jgi:hypothetical protein
MNWTLAFILLGLAVLITLLMRPDIFLTMLRGNRDTAQRKVYRAKTEQDFQASLTGEPLKPEKRDENHG